MVKFVKNERVDIKESSIYNSRYGNILSILYE